MIRPARQRLVLLFSLYLCVSVPHSFVHAEDWPQWRGPRADGSSTETNLPTHWSANQNVKWSVPLPGKGHGSPIVAAYDLNGSQLWRKSPGHFSSMHGWSCSPMLYEDSIIVNCDHDGPGYIVRLKRDTGEEVWRIERPNHTRSYCNPAIFNVDGVKHMVLSGTKCTTSYDPDTGDLRWLIDGPTEQYVASMVYNPTQNVFCITAGFPEMHTMGISPQGKVLWHHARAKGLAAYVPSPVAC